MYRSMISSPSRPPFIFHSAIFNLQSALLFVRYTLHPSPVCSLKALSASTSPTKKMRVKLAAKLLVIAWTLMKKQEAFDPTYLKS